MKYVSILFVMCCIYSSCQSQYMPQGLTLISGKQWVLTKGMSQDQVSSILGVPSMRVYDSNGRLCWMYLNVKKDVAVVQEREEAWVIIPTSRSHSLIVTFDNAVVYEVASK